MHKNIDADADVGSSNGKLMCCENSDDDILALVHAAALCRNSNYHTKFNNKIVCRNSKQAYHNPTQGMYCTPS